MSKDTKLCTCMRLHIFACIHTNIKLSDWIEELNRNIVTECENIQVTISIFLKEKMYTNNGYSDY